MATRTTIEADFSQRYGVAPLLVARAPGRVNLIGEHTDYNGGPCLPIALRQSTTVAAARREDRQVRLASRQDQPDWSGALDRIAPGSVEGWVGYAAGVLWALREQGYDVPGLDLLVDGGVPIGAGLSSSAALECAVAVAVLGVLGAELDRAAREAVVEACIRAETEVAGAPTGGMDQTIAMHAEAGAALLIDFAGHTHRAVALPLDPAGLTLLVTDTRVSHQLTDGAYADRRADCEAAARALGVDFLAEAELARVDRLEDDRLRRRARHVVTETQRVASTVAAIHDLDWERVGAQLSASHASLRDDFEVSSPELDTAVEAAEAAGGLGARMTGGGFGGSTVALVPTERVEATRRAIDAAFAAAGYRPPEHLLAEPGTAAGLVTP